MVATMATMLALTGSDWLALIPLFFTSITGLIVAVIGAWRGAKTNYMLTNGHDQMTRTVADLTRQLQAAGLDVKVTLPPPVNHDDPWPPATTATSIAKKRK